MDKTDTKPRTAFNTADLKELLPIYYNRLFPYKPHYNWMTYGRKPTDYYVYREFALILEDDVHLRYRSFDGQGDFQATVKRLRPHKIDIGPVFDHRPREHKRTPNMVACERELVMDIDLTDYDDVRACCQGGSMCTKCWKLMIVAVKVLTRLLKQDLSMEHFMFVYSGRRGVHCWVADSWARALIGSQRAALVDYISVVNGNENKTKKFKVYGDTLHQSLQYAYRIICGVEEKDGSVENKRDYFFEIAQDQGWLSGEDDFKRILVCAPDEAVRTLITSDLEGQSSESLRWTALKARFDPETFGLDAALSKDVPRSARWFLPEMVLQMCYPRLDQNVTKHVNHLLKSPFCVHPKTGKIAVPLNTNIIDTFNIDSVPRIDQLVRELGEMKSDVDSQETETNRRALDYKRTSLRDYVDTFSAFADRVCAASAKEHGIVRNEPKMDTVDVKKEPSVTQNTIAPTNVDENDAKKQNDEKIENAEVATEKQMEVAVENMSPSKKENHPPPTKRTKTIDDDKDEEMTAE